ncbi:helix-turn-helix domain-containing protein [Cohnella sp.]|uniref:helix-turn-helix domain-containing protein n=1 Tax=Cohnella sp. TaxID=1883426 RepID=UPI003561937A
MNWIRNKRLVKAVGILSILLLLLVSSSIFSIYIFFNKELKRQLTDTNMELLGQLDQKLELTMKNMDKLAIQMLNNRDITRFYDYELNEQESRSNSFRISNYFADVVSSNEYVFSIDLYSYSKHQLVSGTLLNEQEFIQSYQWVNDFEPFEGYSKWMSTRRVVLDQSNYPIYRNVVTFVRTYPLISDPDVRKGAIAVNIKEELLYDLIRKTSDQDEGETFVIDANGVVVLHRDKKILGINISEMPYIQSILNKTQSNGHISAEVEQTPSSIFYVNQDYTGWKIVRFIPEVQFNQPLSVVRYGLLLLAIVLFVMSMLFVAVVGGWTLKPVNRFIQSMTGRLTVHPKGHLIQKYSDEFQYFESTVEHILQDRELLYKQVNESKPLMKWQLLTELLSNRDKKWSSLQSYMDKIGIRLKDGQFVVMYVEFDNKHKIATMQDMHLYAYALCNIAEELMNAESLGIAVEVDNGKCAVIMSFGDQDSAEYNVMRAVSVADLMRNFVREYFNQTITVGIGDSVNSFNDIHLSYKQSIEAFRYKLVMGGNSIITNEEITSDQSPQFYRFFAMTDGIVVSVKMADSEKLRYQVGKWFELFAEQNVPPEMIMQLIVQCLMEVATVAAEIGVNVEEILPGRDMYDVLNQYEQLDHLQQHTVNVLEHFIERIREKRNSRDRNEVIDKVLLYIQQQYNRSDMSLNLLASEFRLSVSYLSKLFKEQKECNFIDYLMDYRMSKAMEMLVGTDEMIRTIAEKVGYSNVNSFVRIFKKISGLTPTEYREKYKE